MRQQASVFDWMAEQQKTRKVTGAHFLDVLKGYLQDCCDPVYLSGKPLGSIS
jgi:hypothetical protein